MELIEELVRELVRELMIEGENECCEQEIVPQVNRSVSCHSASRPASGELRVTVQVNYAFVVGVFIGASFGFT